MPASQSGPRPSFQQFQVLYCIFDQACGVQLGSASLHFGQFPLRGGGCFSALKVLMFQTLVWHIKAMSGQMLKGCLSRQHDCHVCMPVAVLLLPCSYMCLQLAVACFPYG